MHFWNSCSCRALEACTWISHKATAQSSNSLTNDTSCNIVLLSWPLLSAQFLAVSVLSPTQCDGIVQSWPGRTFPAGTPASYPEATQSNLTGGTNSPESSLQQSCLQQGRRRNLQRLIIKSWGSSCGFEHARSSVKIRYSL